MQKHIGEVFEGVVSGLTKWGMYVELPNTIEGLIHVVNMADDHYEYDEAHYQMTGIHTHKVYKLGQKLKVRVTGTDRLLRTIDFEIADEGDMNYGEKQW